MNEYVTIVLEAATDPSLAGTEVERTRERLARAGLLATNPRRPGVGPDPVAVEAAGRRGGAWHAAVGHRQRESVTLFADTSAVVKLYVPEIGAEALPVGRRWITELTRVELPAALWRKWRGGELAAEDAVLLVSAFEVDYYGDEATEPRFVVVRMTDAVLSGAARLVSVGDLRSSDAIQLASAVQARQVDGDVATFAAFDTRLRAAAAGQGFGLVP